MDFNDHNSDRNSSYYNNYGRTKMVRQLLTRPVERPVLKQNEMSKFRWTVKYNDQVVGKDFFTKRAAKAHWQTLFNQGLYGYTISKIAGYTKVQRDETFKD